EPTTQDDIAWGKVNVPISEEHYERLRADVAAYLNREELFVRDVFAGADPDYRLSVRVVTTSAW
ncbi:MAG: phosphoenolpyruvate carboxykinase (ATP), partial [Gemmatimonadetes bacterium]|nr:phosphoenolpyruvate carboxykinase (ATP) [Pseudomonadales bacterium]NIS03175.1 phosphoenolpyruvate carboxykinase (ATP) [Gemmatimonadota bacterium]NIU52637.1 phosphoenolpyruvate carboxykinase (ATP) [Gemmatimonadota bacterium]NIV25557.1 phosphoenolpyruvate carboxykinase (ATP) [Gemmatimonadota bacterium]NIW36440.1 phosphoenolpyruvate carboxykinase (ATP) [Gemmatimonadota bacterium]